MKPNAMSSELGPYLLILVVSSLIGGTPMLAQQSCPEWCQCSDTTAGHSLAHCHGDDTVFSQLLTTLPANTTHFTFLAEERERSYDFFTTFEVAPGQLRNLPRLKAFTLRPAAQTSSQRQAVVISDVWPLCELSTTLEELHLNMKMRYVVHQELFHPRITCLPSLRLLNLSDIESLTAYEIPLILGGLEGKPLEVLLLRAVQQVPDSRNLHILNFTDVFRPLKTAPLRELDFSDNGIGDLTPGLINNLPHLVKIDLSKNFLFNRESASSFSTALEALLHPKLEHIDVSHQLKGGSVDPSTFGMCSLSSNDIVRALTNRSALCDALKCIFQDPQGVILCDIIQPTSELIDFSCQFPVRIPIGPNLRELRLDWYNMYLLAQQAQVNSFPLTVCINANNSLQVLDGTGATGVQPIIGDSIRIEGAHSSRVLKLDGINAVFKKDFFFASFPDLGELYLRGNRVQMDANNTLFSNNPKLELLDLSDNGITHISQLQFKHLQSLKMLNLSGNLIRTLNFTLPPSNSSQLEHVNLRQNKISVIPRAFLSELDQHGHSLSLDLSANLLSCSCQEAYMIEWVKQTDVTLIQEETYQCEKENGDSYTISSISVEEFLEECNPSISQAVIAACASVSVLLVIGIMLAVIYRKRWRIRYFLYKLCRKDAGTEPQDDVFAYDAFVSYRSEDRYWVHHALRHEIEGNRQRRLFIYMRDLPAGGALDERLHDAISQCRRQMFVLSPNFLASEYCMYELQTARWKLMAQGLDTMILVILEDLPIAEVPGPLTSVLEAIGHLKWTQDEQGQRMFWDKLEQSLLRPPQKIIRQLKHETIFN